MGKGPITSFAFCAYLARTLHVLYICFGTYSLMFRQILEICRREVCENFPCPRSLSPTLVYHHRHLFSCNFFAHVLPWRGRGPYPRSHFTRTEHVICTYSTYVSVHTPRCLHMFRHVLLDVSANPRDMP